MTDFLVIGGCGYIGSHLVWLAKDQNLKCTVIDDLSTGHESLLPEGTDFKKVDITDKKSLLDAVTSLQPKAVFNFAAKALTGESNHIPLEYYKTNTSGLINVLEVLKELNLKIPFIYSGSCSVYGNPKKIPIEENTPKNPESTYARTKHFAEEIISDYSKELEIPAITLRYFNACGSDKDLRTGELHDPETHLIPVIIKSVIDRKPFKLFGNDYPTKDGTCVRDYIHVTDLAIAHMKAFQFLKGKNYFYDAINLGTGNGYSNLEIIKTIEQLLNIKSEYEISERRLGDPATLFADNSKAKSLLNFEPKFSDLKTIVQDTHNWLKKNFTK